jgi:hypothetical protein
MTKSIFVLIPFKPFSNGQELAVELPTEGSLEFKPLCEEQIITHPPEPRKIVNGQVFHVSGTDEDFDKWCDSIPELWVCRTSPMFGKWEKWTATDQITQS